jgi:hypothetical protein
LPQQFRQRQLQHSCGCEKRCWRRSVNYHPNWGLPDLRQVTSFHLAMNRLTRDASLGHHSGIKLGGIGNKAVIVLDICTDSPTDVVITTLDLACRLSILMMTSVRITSKPLQVTLQLSPNANLETNVRFANSSATHLSHPQVPPLHIKPK